MKRETQKTLELLTVWTLLCIALPFMARDVPVGSSATKYIDLALPIIVLSPLLEEFFFRAILFYICGVNFYKMEWIRILEDQGKTDENYAFLEEIADLERKKSFFRAFFDSGYRNLSFFTNLKNNWQEANVEALAKKEHSREYLKIELVCLVSSFLFAISHSVVSFIGIWMKQDLATALANPYPWAQVILLFVAGMIWAKAYLSTKTLFVPIYCHMTLNLSVVILVVGRGVQCF